MATTRRQVFGPRSDGARALDAYLREFDISVPHFCEEHRLDRLAVQRALSGKTSKRIGADLAIDVERATDGRVKAELWHGNTVRSDESGRLPDVHSESTGTGS